MSRRFGNRRRYDTRKQKDPQDLANLSRHGGIGHCSRYIDALEAACNRAEKDAEFRAQHGPVIVKWKDGKSVDADDPATPR